MPEKKCIGFNPPSHLHWLDHIAIVCIIMDIPLIFFDQAEFNFGVKCYPGLTPILLDPKSFTTEYLIANYDVLFLSELLDRQAFKDTYGHLETKYQKNFRWVHVPHGFSDKGIFLKLCANEDITLVYGQNMIDLLKYENAYQNLNSYVFCGNFRYTYYKQHKLLYDTIMQQEILNRFDKKRPVILYAPTWEDADRSSTYYDACSILIDNLPCEYNLIIKLHPAQKRYNPQMFRFLLTKYAKKPYVLFVHDYPLIFPFLEYADIYIGDMSSIGYDFLAFNKPMYFLNKHHLDPATDRRLFLYQCGVEVTPEHYKDIYHIIEKTLPADADRFTRIRSRIYDYTFGPERPFSDIKADIIKAYSAESE